MSNKVRQKVDDAASVCLVAGSALLFVDRACADDDSLYRAGQRALSGAVLAAPIAGAVGFAIAKGNTSRKNDLPYPENALPATAIFGVGGAAAGGLVCGFLSMVWDAFRV